MRRKTRPQPDAKVERPVPEITVQPVATTQAAPRVTRKVVLERCQDGGPPTAERAVDGEAGGRKLITKMLANDSK